MSFTIGIDAEIILDGTGYFVLPRSYTMTQPRIRKATVRADGGQAYVDLGPGKRTWSMTILCLNDQLKYDGTLTGLSGQEYRDALRASYIGSVGALDMVNFGAPDTIPERYSGRKLHVHSPQVTLMRTTAEENERMGRWIGERLNAMDGPVRFFLPEGGVSALDAPGQPFWDPDADAALFRALDQTVRQTSNRQLIRLKRNINEPEFAAAIVAAFRLIVGRTSTRRRVAR